MHAKPSVATLFVYVVINRDPNFYSIWRSGCMENQKYPNISEDKKKILINRCVI